MRPPAIPTMFAPAERSSPKTLERQASLFRDSGLLRNFADTVPTLLFVLNENRQIVFVNRLVCEVLGLEDGFGLIGQRVGEALRCIHARETDGGCGTTESCRECGGVRAALICLRGESNEQECRITRDEDYGSLDLRISAAPFTIGKELFAVYVATDIADEKRREALEHTFFHDIINTASGLQGFMEVFGEAGEHARPELIAQSRLLVRMLIDEIVAQRELAEAERGEIVLRPVTVTTRALLAGVKSLYEKHAVAGGRSVVIGESMEDLTLEADKALLQRVIGNMVKNALEASRKGETVTIGSSQGEGEVRFWVHNAGAIPRDVQLQIFQRSFSTKGKGRGLGTYSMKLLGEKYLGGKVSFTTSLDDGTTFTFAIPFSPRGDAGVRRE